MDHYSSKSLTGSQTTPDTISSGMWVGAGTVGSFDKIAYLGTDEGLWEFVCVDSAFYLTQTPDSQQAAFASDPVTVASGVTFSGDLFAANYKHQIPGWAGFRWFNVMPENGAAMIKIKKIGDK